MIVKKNKKMQFCIRQQLYHIGLIGCLAFKLLYSWSINSCMNGSTNFEIMQGMYCYVSQDNWGKRRLLHESLGFVVRHLHPHLVRLGLLVDPVQLLVLLLHLKRIIYIIDSAVCSGSKVHLSAHVVRHVPQVADHCPNLKLSFMFFFF